MSKQYIKEAEQNAINQAKYCQDVLSVIDALQTFTSRYMDDRKARKACETLHEYRNYVYSEMNDRLARCFMFVGVGGKEAEEFSFEQFKEHFGEGRYAVMQFLDEGGQHPSCWNGEEEEFKQEAKDVIENHE